MNLAQLPVITVMVKNDVSNSNKSYETTKLDVYACALEILKDKWNKWILLQTMGLLATYLKSYMVAPLRFEIWNVYIAV